MEGEVPINGEESFSMRAYANEDNGNSGSSSSISGKRPSSGEEDGASIDGENFQSSDSERDNNVLQPSHITGNGVCQGETVEDGEEALKNDTALQVEESLSNRCEDPDQVFICFECGETFDDKESHQLHVKSHNLPFKCSICGVGFNDQDSLIQHAEIHAADKTITNMPLGYEYLGSRESNETLKREKRKYSRDNYDLNSKECPICHKTFSTVYVMKNHMDIHRGIKDHKCNICGKSFSAKRYLAKHIDTHSDEKPYKCSVCEKAFRTAYYLRVHTRLHTGDLPFGCQVCGKTFNVVTELKVHMRNHTGEKPFACSVCGMGFAARSYLRTHMRIHTGEKPFECHVCGQRFGRSNGLKTHMATHLDLKEHKCNFCDKGFNRQDELKSHILRIHKKETQELPERKKTLRSNMDVKYIEDDWDGEILEQEARDLNNIEATEEEKTDNLNGVICDLDGKTPGGVGLDENFNSNNYKVPLEEGDDTVDNSYLVARKMIEQKKDACRKSNDSDKKLSKINDVTHANLSGLKQETVYKDTCGLVTRLPNVDLGDSSKEDNFKVSGQQVSSKESFTIKCHICNAVIDRLRDLIITASGDRHLECSVCKTISNQKPPAGIGDEKGMTNNVDVPNNDGDIVRPVHARRGPRKKKRSNVCPICEKEFAPTYLKVHMEIHSGLKPYKCGVCGKVFNARRYLTKHLETHKEIKKYRCSICDKTFSSKYYLKIHTSVHTGQKAFSCEICGKQFNIRPELNTHMRVHTGEKPFACSLCDRAFISSAYLRSHMKIHTGEKNHECPICEKKFSRSNDLKIHISTHTGDKPYKCLKCGKGFNRSGEIDLHMKSSHALKFYEFDHNGEVELSTNLVLDPADTAKFFNPENLTCKECGKEFAKKIHLKAHLKTHTGERPFSCYVCFKTFPDKAKVKRHLKVHEKEDARKNGGGVGGDSLEHIDLKSSGIEMEYDKFDYRLHLP